MNRIWVKDIRQGKRKNRGKGQLVLGSNFIIIGNFQLFGESHSELIDFLYCFVRGR